MTQPPAPQHHTHERRYKHDDEISLVDFAVILIRRWKIMAVIFFAIVTLAMIVAFLQTPHYGYTSLYSVAEYTNDNGQRVGVESPASVVAKARNLYLGQATRKLLEEQKLTSLPFDISISNPNNTLLLQLDSEASESNQPLVAELHQRLITRLQQDQRRLVESRRESLQRQLASARQALESAQQSESASAAELVATYYSRVTDLESQLNELREGEVTQHAVQSLSSHNISKKMIYLLGLLLGGGGALFSAFIFEFLTRVIEAIRSKSR